jgi:hypothetical protein
VYCQKVDEVKAIQQKCMSAIAHQRYRIKQITETAKKFVYVTSFVIFVSL